VIDISITHNTQELIARFETQVANLAPGSPRLKEAFTKIGLYVTSIAKLNIRQWGLIDTGRLINSVRYEFFKDATKEGIRAGSYNVPYAWVHEFGFRGSVRVPAHQRMQRQAFGRPIDPRAVDVREHSRMMEIPPRPYLRPAIKTSQAFIIDTLRAALLYTEG
jgi:hypothetical protein